MNETDAAATAEPLVFERKRSASTHGAWWVVGGCLASLMLIVGFGLALLVGVNSFGITALTAGPSVAAVVAFSRAWTLARAELRVVVCGPGILIEDVRRARRLPWESIGHVVVDFQPPGRHQALLILGKRGEKLATISDAFEHFDELVAVIEAEVKRRDQGDAARIQGRRRSKNVVLAAVLGTMMLLAGAFGVWGLWDHERVERLLRDEAVPGTSRILRRFVAPDGVTRRLEHELTTPDGRTFKHNVEMERAAWDALEDHTSVAVTYAPSDPGVCRLRVGEKLHYELPHGREAWVIISGGGVVSLLCYAIVILAWLGWDVDWDRKTKRLSLKRIELPTRADSPPR